MSTEAQFRRTVVSRINKETQAFAQSIESSTGSGIPDMFITYQWKTVFAELKMSVTKEYPTVNVRPVQLAWAKKFPGPWIMLVKHNNLILGFGFEVVLKAFTDSKNNRVNLGKAKPLIAFSPRSKDIYKTFIQNLFDAEQAGLL